MNRSDIKQLLKEGIVALLVLLGPVLLPFMMPQLVVAVWMSGLIVVVFKKRQYPKIVEESRLFRNFERLLYFQIINWSFGFFFIPVIEIFIFVIPVAILFLGFNRERRENPTFIKWAKYVGFHIFNLVLIFNLLRFFPNVGAIEEVILVFSTIIFVNSGNAVIYLKVEPKIHRGKKMVALLIMLVMMISIAISMFPQEGGGSVLGVIFGG